MFGVYCFTLLSNIFTLKPGLSLPLFIADDMNTPFTIICLGISLKELFTSFTLSLPTSVYYITVAHQKELAQFMIHNWCQINNSFPCHYFSREENLTIFGK